MILRPFPFEVFSRGAPAGPSVLLRKLKGEHIDWEEVLLSFKKALRQTLTLIIQTKAHVQKYCEIKKKRRLEK